MADLTATFNPSDNTTPGHYATSQTAMLIMDFHSLFVEKVGGPNAPAAFQVAVQMRAWAKAQGIQVIHDLIDVHSTPYATCKDSGKFAGMMATMRSGGADEPAELVDGAADDVTFFKRIGHVSALKSPGLLEYLEKKGIKSLILAGLSTSGCVARTAIMATDAEYVVTTISDACADPAEGVHDIMVGKFLNNRGWVTTAAEFQQGYTKARAGK